MAENIARQGIVLDYLAKFVKAVTQIEKRNLLQKKLDMKILGIGNAIIDVICKIDDNFLNTNGLTKSTMKLVDVIEFNKLIKNLKIEKTVSGGSVANSIVGLSQLGNEVGFIGKVNDDDFGKKYLKGLEKITFVDSKYDVLKDSDALVLLTEWKEFRSPNFKKIKSQLKTPIIFDGRNQYIAYDLDNKGLEYHRIGK